MSRSRDRSYCPVGKRNCFGGCSHADVNEVKLAKAPDVDDEWFEPHPAEVRLWEYEAEKDMRRPGGVTVSLSLAQWRRLEAFNVWAQTHYMEADIARGKALADEWAYMFE